MAEKILATRELSKTTSRARHSIVVSLLAKTEYGVPRVVARINHPNNEWLFNESWGIDVAVSTPRLISALVEEAGQCRGPGAADDLQAERGEPG